MDGNRRWAKAHHLPVLEGHRRVANIVLEKLVEHAADRGIQYITFWAFSTENWSRAKDEVKGIMTILKKSIGYFGKRMHEKGVQLRIIGDMTRFDKDLQNIMADVVTLTKDNKKITVTLALNYGGRDELLRAINSARINEVTNERIDEKEFEKYLDTAGIPDPDMIVRTGGEQRLSGFLPWQGAYSELYFPTWFMPDFTEEKLDEVIEEFAHRSRRFGK